MFLLSFLCLRLRFFYCFIFMLIFGNPLPTPWASLAPFWIDFSAVVGLTFLALSAARADFLQSIRKKVRKNLAETYAENYQETYKEIEEFAEN